MSAEYLIAAAIGGTLTALFMSGRKEPDCECSSPAPSTGTSIYTPPSSTPSYHYPMTREEIMDEITYRLEVDMADADQVIEEMADMLQDAFDEGLYDD